MNFTGSTHPHLRADLMTLGPANGFERIRASRREAFQEFKKIKARMRNSNSWDHYEFCSHFLLVKAAEHRALTRILIKNGVN